VALVERTNGWQLAEAAGDPTPDRMQRLGEHRAVGSGSGS
jgi:hypothetical protein